MAVLQNLWLFVSAIWPLYWVPTRRRGVEGGQRAASFPFGASSSQHRTRGGTLLPGELTLLVNLLAAIGTGFLGATIAVLLGQSAILGYLAAGIIIGPFAPRISGNADSVQQMAEIGLVLLMFSVGLEIPFRYLLRAGRVALVGGGAQIAIVMAAGYGVGIALGWSPLQALFLGAVVSISSTAVLGKVLGERGERDSPHGQLALAWAAVQDLATVLLVVLLGALGTAGENPVVETAWALGKAGLFLLVIGPLGHIVLPWSFERVAALHSREVFILMVASVAIGIAYLSTFFGLSLALGAFVAGVALAESELSHEILGEITPITDVFAALFFVSIGMLIDPAALAANPVVAIAVLGLIVIAKGLVSSLIPLAFGYTSSVALLTGISLAQAAEFSFVLASLGTGLGVLSQQSFSLILVGVAASIALSPVLLQAASPLARRLAMRRPSRGMDQRAGPDGGEQGLRGHAVLCGYGRVGRVIAGALSQRGLPFSVIDEEPRAVRNLRAHGVRAFLGSAANPILLERAGAARARILVVALPDSLAVRQIVDHSRELNPNLDVVVRTHSWTERDWLLRRGVGEVVMGELELALEMTRHTLHRLGVSSPEAQAVVQGLRRRVEVEPYADILDDIGGGR